jgi:hypothetical protein
MDDLARRVRPRHRAAVSHICAGGAGRTGPAANDGQASPAVDGTQGKPTTFRLAGDGAAAPAAYVDGAERAHDAEALKAWWPASHDEAYTAS